MSTTTDMSAENLVAELRRIVDDIENLYKKQAAELAERWGEDGDVPVKELPDYDQLLDSQVGEDSGKLSEVHRRLAKLIEPPAAT
ncbi:hypothetical protein [Streptomyces luteireticuli]|uniref:hypothetical protein n=1 Tax=Streptomyces luteireticuli TaxID=173858 RepID=UPI0035590C68